MLSAPPCLLAGLLPMLLLLCLAYCLLYNALYFYLLLNLQVFDSKIPLSYQLQASAPGIHIYR